MSDMENKEIKPGEISLPIEWQIPADIQSRYATNIIVQSGQHEFILYFFEAQPPLLLGGTPEENLSHLEQLGKIQAKCIGKIIISAERFQEFINAMQGTLNLYLAGKSTGKDS